MNAITKENLDNLFSKDAKVRYNSFQYVMNLTEQPVAWAYNVWGEMLDLTKKGDNHQRTIAVQLLSNLAKSDSEKRMLKDFDKMLTVTRDERFVTARHSLQCLWKVAIVNKEYQKKVIDGLTKRFEECSREKNCTLIRYDILEVFRKIYDKVKDESIARSALDLIKTEGDSKYAKKYMGLWKDQLL